MSMLDKVKLVLRVSGTTFDSEINDLIASARQELILSGVLASKANSDTDSLIERCIKTYCKAHFGWDNPESDKFHASYSSIKLHLTLSEEYTAES